MINILWELIVISPLGPSSRHDGPRDVYSHFSRLVNICCGSSCPECLLCHPHRLAYLLYHAAPLTQCAVHFVYHGPALYQILLHCDVEHLLFHLSVNEWKDGMTALRDFYYFFVLEASVKVKHENFPKHPSCVRPFRFKHFTNIV